MNPETIHPLPSGHQFARLSLYGKLRDGGVGMWGWKGLAGGALLLTLSALAVGCSSSPTLVPIEPGTFVMGSEHIDECWDSYYDEVCQTRNEPQHEVTLTIPFAMMSHEVTQGDFYRLMKYNPSRFSTCGSLCPVESVNWYETLNYANARSREEGLPECFDCQGINVDVVCDLKPMYPKPQECLGYRLPTEAEWEYAARAGTTTTYYSGPRLEELVPPEFCINDPVLDPIAWYLSTSKIRNGDDCLETHGCREETCLSPQPVQRKNPNAWGLFDMLGNVSEWVWDVSRYGFQGEWSRQPDPVASQDDNGESQQHIRRIVKGCGFRAFAGNCRCGWRYGSFQEDRSPSKGFRLIRSLKDRPADGDGEIE